MFRCAAPILLLLAQLSGTSQSISNTPEFEAASVKPVPPGTPYGGMRGGPGTSSPGQIYYEATTLHAIVARAYGVQRFQIVGPKWFEDDRFDLVAKIPPGTTTPQLQLMLQRLLADRFHLELHKENRPSSAYEMTVASSGLKMKPAPLPQTQLAVSENAPPAQPGGMRWGGTGEQEELQGRAVTIRQILVWLSEETQREIVDKTGLMEAYDFDLLWTPASSPEQNDPSDAGILDSAIEKYLGLKVTARKLQVETLVIDRLERAPVQN